MRNEYLKTLFRMSCDSGSADSRLGRKEKIKSAHIRAINYGNFASSPLFIHFTVQCFMCYDYALWWVKG
jgi:hypothetical protein